MQNSYVSKSATLEQELLFSVLDHDAVPNILKTAKKFWGVELAEAFLELQKQASLGRLRAYHSFEPDRTVGLDRLSMSDVVDDHLLFVDPTDQTSLRLNEINQELRRALPTKPG